MPRVNIYIRDSDWERWKALSSIPEFIHKAINQNTTIKSREVGRSTDGLADYKDKLCKHFQPLGFCLQKGCKQ